MKRIDLRSDTFTLPTDEMIEAIVQAHKDERFGDDVAGEDEDARGGGRCVLGSRRTLQKNGA